MSDRYRRLIVLENPDRLAHALADRVVDCANAAIATRGRFGVALAGGSTPEAAYRLLAAEPRRSALDWTRVRVFFSDERCVPPTDSRSNYKMAKEAFLDAVGLPADRVARMAGEIEPDRAAAAYAAVLREELGALPVLDLVLLGMGPDGHTASLFPGVDPYADDARLVRAPWVEQFSTYRITFTPSLINAARSVVVATAGVGKAPALAQVFDGAERPATYPVQAVTTSSTATWLVDRAATDRMERAKLASVHDLSESS